MLSLKWDREKKMKSKSKSKKIGLVVLTVILAIAAISVATVGAQQEPTPTPTPTLTPTENETLECKTLWYFDDQSVQCQQDKFCGDYMYQSLHTFETEEECKAAFETYLKEKGKVTSTPAPPGFEVGFAIAGLLAVAYLVLRRRK